MAQTKIRIAEQLQASSSARSILITDGSSKPAYHAPTTGADTILFWDDSASNWAPLTIGTNLSISSTTLNASAGAGGYAEVQEEGTPLTARTKINFIGSGLTAADDAGNTRTNVTMATILNNIATTGSVSLTSHVSGDLPFANLAQGSALSVLGVTGNATADNASIAAGTDHQVLRRSGTALAFGAVNLAQSAAVTGTLAATNGGTGHAVYAVGDLLSPNTTTAISRIPAVASGSVLKSAGTNTLPVWGTLAASDLTDGANLAHINATETISAVWTFNTLPESSVAPTTGNQLTNKTYVDGLIANQRKTSVRAATIAPGTLSTSFENGDSIDGVTLVTGDRILIKDQASNAQNGIYTVNASGAPTRATDMDAASEVDGTFVIVEDGTTLAGTIWLTVSEVTTLNTDAIVFTQINKATDLIAGAGMTASGLTFNVIAGDDSITVNADNLLINLHTTPGLEVVTTDGLRIKSDTVTANTLGITLTANGAGVKYSSSSFTETSETLELASAVGGSGLTLSAGALNINVDNSTIEINADALRVKDNGITLAKMAQMNTDRLLGRDTAGTGNVEEISVTAGLGFLGGPSIGHNTTGASSVTHTGAQVPNAVTIDAYGHVTGFTTRNLALDDLNDVTITGVATNDVLTYSGSAWVNSPASGGTTERAFVEGSTASTLDLDANSGVVKDRDGNNVAFTIPTDTDKFFVYRNGVRQMETGGAPGNVTRDYSVNTTTHVLTLTYALTSDEIIMVEKIA